MNINNSHHMREIIIININIWGSEQGKAQNGIMKIIITLQLYLHYVSNMQTPSIHIKQIIIGIMQTIGIDMVQAGIKQMQTESICIMQLSTDIMQIYWHNANRCWHDASSAMMQTSIDMVRQQMLASCKLVLA